MRSNDLARLAGVTVRTLRHYHQIGLLPEPARDPNGYRRYGVGHLVRLLRIGRLSALGLSLSDLPALLDGADARRSDILDELDAALTQQIARLQEQRQIIAALRENRAPLDMPPDLAGVLLPLEAGRSINAIRSGREQSVLLDRMTTAEGRDALARLYDRLSDPDLAAVALDLGQRFDRLDPETSQAEIEKLADTYVAQLGPWMRDYEAVMAKFTDSNATALLWAHGIDATTPPQQQFLRILTKKLSHDS